MTAGKLYGVLYADPPWRFEPFSRETGMSRAADNHYATLSTDAIAAIRVPAAEDSILFLSGDPGDEAARAPRDGGVGLRLQDNVLLAQTWPWPRLLVL
jgi:hypothetical protein